MDESNHKGPNAAIEPDSEDVWRVPITVARTESSFMVVRLRADSFSEALERAQMHVRMLCDEERVEIDDEGALYDTDWVVDGYEERGLEKDIPGVITDYGVNFDITDEPTRAETNLAAAQLDLQFLSKKTDL